jgi:hypothetical protein
MGEGTTTATGDTQKAAEAMGARLRAAGFPEGDVQVFSPAPHKGNLVARLHGSGARKPILLVAHIDVVPANREDWTVDEDTDHGGRYFFAAVAAAPGAAAPAPADAAASGIGFTMLPGRAFCSPSTTTVSPGFSPSRISH